jgi:CubicO group peptidase (beta-lactamase class C family)
VAFDQLVQAAREAMASAPVPGCALGLLAGGEVQATAFGITSVENPLEVTPDTLFQIGSISKTFTGTLAMQLVEDGRLDLDTPVRAYLPGFRLGDEEAAAAATMRHLLTHMGGWVGDSFEDPGRGDDALARRVEHLAELPQVVPLATLFDYNNVGFSIAGRVLEVVGGAPFEQLVEERVLRPLGLEQTYFYPEDVMTHRFAVGHYGSDEGTVVARPWVLPRAANSAGGLSSTLGDLLRYAGFHLGANPAWLERMREPQAEIRPGESIGITWMLRRIEGLQLFGHDGGTNGQITDLLIAPEHGEAVAVFTNSNRGGEVTAAVRRASWPHSGSTNPSPSRSSSPRAGYRSTPVATSATWSTSRWWWRTGG